MPHKGRGERGEGRHVLSHLPAVVLFAALSVVWTWPLVLNFNDHIPGLGGDNYSFLWNLWWMRKALSSPDLEFFHSTYLFSPFGVDLINHPHTALQGYVSATALGGMSIVPAENLYIIVSVFLNAVCAYALAFDMVRKRSVALFAGIAFGGSPYVAAHLLGYFDLLTAWVIPLFALFLRRSLRTGSIGAAVGAGVCVAIAAYAAYDHVVYLAIFALTYTLASWHCVRLRIALRVQRPPSESFWRGAQALMITVATFALVSLPLIVQAFRLALSGRYVSQTYFWRSAPRGIDALVPLVGNPFHPLYGGAVSDIYNALGLDRIETVGWLGVVPLVVLLMNRGQWFDTEEARRWKAVLVVFAIWALGPFLTVAGFDTALPLPQALARFVPLVDNARMPGRAIVCVYLALGVLMALRMAALAGLKASTTTDTTDTTVVAPTFRSALGRPAIRWALLALLALDYLHAPIPLTALDRPAVYEQLATIPDNGAVIELPFGIGDGLSVGRGSQDRRLLYNATIHGHPVVGGYIGRMPPDVAMVYDAMPVVGNLLRLSNGEEAEQERAPMSVPFRYLVLDTRAASQELNDYVHRTLDMDLISSGDGKQLYAVQGPRSGNVIASR